MGLEIDNQSSNRNELRDSILLSNSLEYLIKAAQQGKGTFIAYDKMTALKKATLVNILRRTIVANPNATVLVHSNPIFPSISGQHYLFKNRVKDYQKHIGTRMATLKLPFFY